MTTLLVLSAGKGNRIGQSDKWNVVVGGQRMIRWQQKAVDACRTIIVAHRSVHYPEDGCSMVWTDEQRGPVQALKAGLKEVDDGETVLVAYADTWWSYTPPSTDWVGVCRAEGGRVWDWIGYDATQIKNTFERSFISPNSTVKACVGLYNFADIPALKEAVTVALDEVEGDEVHMVEVLNRYRPPLNLLTIPEWRDVGTADSWRLTDRQLRGLE